MSENPVLVTTRHKGVFFGYLSKREDDTVILTDARNCMYWTGTGGVFGLASIGPNAECRIGVRCDSLELLDITSIATCSAEAEVKWKEAKTHALFA